MERTLRIKSTFYKGITFINLTICPLCPPLTPPLISKHQIMKYEMPFVVVDARVGHVKLGAIFAEGDSFDPSKMIRGSPLQTSKS